MDKHEVARLLEEIGVLLELQGENPFKVRAYHNAARALENLDEELDLIVKEERLKDIEGIGTSIAEKISSLILTGHLSYYEELKKSIPAGLLELLKIPGLGGKKIKVLYEELGIKSVEELIHACQKGEVAQLAHFGEKTQSNILNSIAKLKKSGVRFLWWQAMEIAQPILTELSKVEGVQRVEIAGSIRRKLETIGDLDFLVASSTPGPIMNWFTQHPWVEKIIAKGATKSSVQLFQGIQADLRIIPEEQFAFALLYFTGSRDHSIKIRHRANELGYTLSEYSLDSLEPDKPPPFPKHPKKPITEEDIFKTLGLSYIPPELREEKGEIEAAEKGKLPILVEEQDIRGVFHCHTTDSDGHNNLDEMIAAAQALGWEYFGISDHSKSSFQANGMSEDHLLEQVKRIHKINQSGKYSLHVFAGLECDILKNGKMDFSDDILKELDYVVASIHSVFNLDEKTMTARLIKAIENPYTTIIGHVTGRLLLRRDPYPVNLPKVIDACIANNKVMELNAQPTRLDLDWRFWHKAAEKGLKCAINPDAHSAKDLLYYRAGVNIARKGWLEKKHILNTFPLKKVQAYLKNR
jgi:DNA polymerase (family 10)